MALVTLATSDEIRPLLMKAAASKIDPAGKYNIDLMMKSGQCWKIYENGVITGALVTRDDNGELWIMAAAGYSPSDMTQIMADHLLSISAGYRSIAFQTARRGLVKKIQAHGYEISGYILRKKL